MYECVSSITGAVSLAKYHRRGTHPAMVSLSVYVVSMLGMGILRAVGW
jgi:hypothetical protein